MNNEKEFSFLESLMDKPNRELTLIVGGAKVGTKIKLIDNFLHMTFMVKSQ